MADLKTKLTFGGPKPFMNERQRTQSEGSNQKAQHTSSRQRNPSTRSDRCPSSRKESSDSNCSISEDVATIDAIQYDHVVHARKESSESFTFDTDESKYKGMAKTHYINPAKRSHCLQCNRKFSVKIRPHHCRRCGDVYCMKCLRYKRRLNQLARLDPNGKSRKVCRACFSEEDVSLGSSRRLTEEYFKERQFCNHARVLKQRTASLTNSFWRDQLDLEKECSRLTQGFAEAVGTSETKKTFHELQELLKPPKWQKSSFWKLEKQAQSCRVCKGSLGVRKKKRNCKVCGLALCKRCSNQDLLLYMDDAENRDKLPQPKIGIINFTGCPEKEPAISLLLHVCSDCKQYLIVKQNTASPSSTMTLLIDMDKEFNELQNQISPNIVQCEQIIEAFETEEVWKASCQRIAEVLGILKEALRSYESLFYSLRTLGKTGETKSQNILIKHYITAKYEFYMENRHINRRLQRTSESDYFNKADSFTDPHTSANEEHKDEMIDINPHIKPSRTTKTPLGDEPKELGAKQIIASKKKRSISKKNEKQSSFVKGKVEKLTHLEAWNEVDSSVESGGNRGDYQHLNKNLNMDIVQNDKKMDISLSDSQTVSDLTKVRQDTSGYDFTKGNTDPLEDTASRNSGELILMGETVSWKR